MGWLFLEAVMMNPDSWRLGLAPTSNRLYCAVRAPKEFKTSPNSHHEKFTLDNRLKISYHTATL